MPLTASVHELGLAAGAVVVTRGNEQLSDGKTIEYGGDKVESVTKAGS